MKNNNISKSFSFSILMANYNNAKYIEEAINSVLCQTYPNWELIIVDDCSTDDSIKKIESFLKDKRIKFFHHKKNLGYGGTLKTAADNASNDILAILDPDDKLHEKALETIAEAYNNNPEYGFIYSTYWGCDSNLNNCVINKEIGEIIPNNRVFFRERISHFKTFLREAYKKTSGFDVIQKRAVDKDIIFKLEEVTKFKFINKPLYYYRTHTHGISQAKNEFRAGVYLYIAKCKAYRRRLNTNIPNITITELYSEYYKITFHIIIKLVKYIFYFIGVSKIKEFLCYLYLKLINKILKKLLRKIG